MKSRKSIRLPGYDYAQSRAYFITICTYQRAYLFGEVVNGQMKLNKYGQIVRECWNEISKHFLHIESDEFTIMPNHLHGIVMIGNDVGARHAVPLHEQFGKPIHGGIPTIVRSFKSAVTKHVRELSRMPARIVWQRNYYERVIRSGELNNIREYIINNPAQWDDDSENIRCRVLRS